MPKELIPGKKKTPVYKKSSGFKMKSPLKQYPGWKRGVGPPGAATPSSSGGASSLPRHPTTFSQKFSMPSSKKSGTSRMISWRP